MRVPIAPILAVALVLALAAPSTLASSLTAPQSTRPPRAGVHALTDLAVVTINGAGATPQVLTVDAGSIVQWWNRDDIPHTITADDGSFGPLQVNDGDQSAAISLPPGAHGYHINNVSNGSGTIIVRDNTQPPTPTVTATSIVTLTVTATPVVTSTPAPPVSPSAVGTSPSGGTPSPTGAASPSATDVGTPAAATVPITIDDNAIDPTVVTVTEGMDVEWTNLETFPVTVTQFGGFVVGPIAPRTSALHQFALAGRYPYYVQGTNLSGLVIVQPTGATPTATTTGTASPIPPTSTPIPPTDTSVPPSSAPTASPTAATATPTSSATTMPTPTATATPTSSPTATDAAEPTAGTNLPSATTEPTAMNSPTTIAFPTATLSPTAMPSATVTPTATNAPSATVAPTATNTPSVTVAPTATSTLSAPGALVTVSRGAFDPQTITITVGSIVGWLNQEALPITIRQFGAFSVGPIAPGDTEHYQFEQPGRFECSLDGTSALNDVLVQADGATPTTTPASTATPPTTNTAPPSAVPTASPLTATATTMPATTTDTATSIPIATMTDTPTTTDTPSNTPTVTMAPSATTTPPSQASVTPTPTTPWEPTLTPTEPPAPSPTAVIAPAPNPTDTAAPPAPTPSDTPSPTMQPDATLTPSPVPPLATDSPSATNSSVAPVTPPTPTTGGLRSLAATVVSTPTRAASTATSSKRLPVTTNRTTSINHPVARAQPNPTTLMTVSGWVWRGRTRVALNAAVTLRNGRVWGQLRMLDSATRLALTSQRIDRPRMTKHGMLVTGTARVGRRTVVFALDVETAGHTTTIVLTVATLHYRLGGPFHGRVVLHAMRPASSAHVTHSATTGRSSPHTRVKAPANARGKTPANARGKTPANARGKTPANARGKTSAHPRQQQKPGKK